MRVRVPQIEKKVSLCALVKWVNFVNVIIRQHYKIVNYKTAPTGSYLLGA
jgi:hypothetical protein